MHPGPVPDCLQQLTQVEEMLIARACPIMSVYCKHGGQGRALCLRMYIGVFVVVASLSVLIL